MQHDSLNTLTLEKWHDELEALLEKKRQDFIGVEKRIEDCVIRIEDVLQKAPENENHRKENLSEVMAQNTISITEQITAFLDQNLRSNYQREEDVMDNMMEQLEKLTRQKKRTPLYLSLFFTLGTVMSTLICTWMYTDHLRQYQDPVFLRYAHLGRSLIEVWSQLSQKERDKITNLTDPKIK